MLDYRGDLLTAQQLKSSNSNEIGVGVGVEGFRIWFGPLR